MYPRDFFDTFWRPTIRDTVFVAMAFGDDLHPVWSKAFRPAIEEDSRPLRAVRVDISTLAGSVITDILDGIAHSRLVLADISITKSGRWSGQRNGNVMYELGLAQAVRQSTEVLVLRNDSEQINFDVAGIQVHQYDFGDFASARTLTAKLIADALAQIDRTKGLLVQRAIDALDAEAMSYLEGFGANAFHGPEASSMGAVLISISKNAALTRLQTLGILRCEPRHASGKPTFFWTPFGKAVIARLGISRGGTP